MNYLEWAEEYEKNAQRVMSVIERKKQRMKEHGLTADERKQLNDDIIAYRKIYYDLRDVAVTLKERAGVSHEA